MLIREFQMLFSIEDNPLNSGLFSKPSKESVDLFSSFHIGKPLENGLFQNTFVFNITEVSVQAVQYILQ